jgi:hypothetical protein
LGIVVVPRIDDGYYEIVDGRPYVMGKQIAWAHNVIAYDFDNDILGYTWHERGFHCRTENGFTLSTMWGVGNYCANNHLRYGYPFNEQCIDAEIAVFPRDGDLLRFVDGDTVQGWVPAGAWFDILGVVASMHTNETIVPVTVIRDTREFDAN